MAWVGKDSESGAFGARLAYLLDSDFLHSFRKSKLVVLAAFATLMLVALSLLAPWLAPHNPFDLKSLSLLDAHTPPVWENGGDARFLLGTDDQGRDVLSNILFGARSSITRRIVGIAGDGARRHPGTDRGLLRRRH
jgi:peptide/nickel transport system permease protein